MPKVTTNCPHESYTAMPTTIAGLYINRLPTAENLPSSEKGKIFSPRLDLIKRINKSFDVSNGIGRHSEDDEADNLLDRGKKRMIFINI